MNGPWPSSTALRSQDLTPRAGFAGGTALRLRATPSQDMNHCELDSYCTTVIIYTDMALFLTNESCTPLVGRKAGSTWESGEGGQSPLPSPLSRPGGTLLSTSPLLPGACVRSPEFSPPASSSSRPALSASCWRRGGGARSHIHEQLLNPARAMTGPASRAGATAAIVVGTLGGGLVGFYAMHYAEEYYQVLLHLLTISAEGRGEML